MKIRVTAFVGLALLASMSVGCGRVGDFLRGDREVTSKHGVRYVLPKGWTGGDLEKPDALAFAMFKDGSGLEGCCSVEETGLSVAAYVENDIQLMRKAGATIVVLGRTVSDTEMTADMMWSDGTVTERYIVRFVQIPGRIYRMAFWGAPDKAEPNIERFKAYVKRFEVVESQPGNGATRVVTSARWGLSWRLPTDWTVNELTTAEGLTVVRFEKKDRAEGSCQIDSFTGTPEQYVETYLKGERDTGAKVTVLAREIGKHDVRLDELYTFGNDTWRAVTRFIFRDGKVYRLWFYAPANQAESWTETFKACANSFEVVAS